MPQEKYLEISQMPEAKQKEIAKLEKSAEEYYQERLKLFGRWDKIKGYLQPREIAEEVAGQKKTFKRKLNLSVLANTEKESWEGFINENKIKRELPAKEVSKKVLDNRIARKKQAILAELAKIARLRREIIGTDQEQEPRFPKEVRDFYQLRLSEYQKAQKHIQNLDQNMEMVSAEIKETEEKGEGEFKRELIKEYGSLEEEYKTLLENEPEAFLYAAYEKIRNLKKSFDQSGQIVETPYVKGMMERVAESLDQNNHVFIHGELGSGKSELAKHISRRVLARDYLERWENGDKATGIKAHPEPKAADYEKDDDDKDDDAAKDEYRKDLNSWLKERESAAEPYLISGHRQIEIETFLGGIKIERIQKMTPEEQVQFKKEKLTDYERQCQKEEPNIAKDKVKADLKMYEKALDMFLENPVETKGYLGMFYKAMSEGKPIIIDEMNAIPHHILIMLNDLLTKRPGEIVKPMVDDLPTFKVQKGFYVLATGNWKPENGLYVGREKIDAAFLSRFDLVNYDYLPNATDFSSLIPPQTEEEIIAQRAAKQKNELFQMMMVRILDKNSGFTLPIEKTVTTKDGKTIEYPSGEKQIFKLSAVARVLQNVFSGYDVDKAYWPTFTGAESNPTELLKENVLSLRHLIPIVDSWKKDGLARPLDDYIFLHYVDRSKARPEEMKYIYQILQTQGGFFNKDNGWPDSTDAAQLNEMTKLNINKKMFGVNELTDKKKALAMADENMPELAYQSPLKTVELLFGKLPSRKKIRDISVEGKEPTDELEAAQVKELIKEIKTLRTELKDFEDVEV